MQRRSNVVRIRVGAAVAAMALVVGLGAAAAPAKTQPGLVKVRFGGDSNETRVVVELSRSATAKLVSSGDMIVFDLPRIGLGDEREGRGQGLVKAWAADGTPGSARLKLELTRPAKVERRFLLAPSDGAANYRYVIDLRADGAPAKTAKPVEPAQAAPKVSLGPMIASVNKPKVEPVKFAPKPLNLKKVIVVDAGHGGHDPGALGENVQEKAVTLAAAKALKAKLEANGRYKVVLTRGDDTFIPLDSRVQMARRAGADLFISLHADSGGNPATRGASVYTLSDKGTERVQRTLAAGDRGLFRVNAPGANLAVSQILLDLTQRATRNKSTSFAQMLMGRVSDEVPMLERSHRDANYKVLLAPDVPAVLLEMGFITNAQDEAFLSNAAKRERLAGAIAEAIDAYFSEETKLASR